MDQLPDVRPPAQGPSAAEIEYRSLNAYFERLFKYTSGAIVIVLTIAGAFLWKSTADVQKAATEAISGTRQSANADISKIEAEAASIARSEAQKRIDEAFQKDNIQRMIERTAQEKVGAAVQNEVDKNLKARIQAFEVQVAETGEISNAGARLRLGFRPALDDLLKKSENPDKPIRDYARSTLLLIGTDYETVEKRHMGSQVDTAPATGFHLPAAVKTAREAMELIRQSQDVGLVAAAFIDLRKMTGMQVQPFDIPAAEQWCAAHRPKCD
jgi:hypothetical protein